jgi:hypothetical protein
MKKHLSSVTRSLLGFMPNAAAWKLELNPRVAQNLLGSREHVSKRYLGSRRLRGIIVVFIKGRRAVQVARVRLKAFDRLFPRPINSASRAPIFLRYLCQCSDSAGFGKHVVILSLDSKVFHARISILAPTVLGVQGLVLACNGRVRLDLLTDSYLDCYRMHGECWIFDSRKMFKSLNLAHTDLNMDFGQH